MIVKKIIDDLKNTLAKLGYSGADIQVSKSKNPKFGDFSSSIPLVLGKLSKKSPIEIAEEIKSEIILSNTIFEKISITEPGFINFKISAKYYYKILNDILNDNDFGKSNVGQNKTANVEFVSANPTGPLTVGHGRNAILGDVVSNILEWNRFKVTREYYFNNAGRQMRILSKSVEARYFERLDKPFDFPEDGYEGQYINDIAEEIIDKFGKDLVPNDSVFKSVPEEKMFQNIKNSLKDQKLKGRITVSGYEGSELIVARLLSESGIDVPYVGTACPRTQMAEQDAEWLESKGAVVKFRASLEDDISAAEAFEPDLAIGTTPLVQHFKQKGKSALYFTNLVSARPLMGQAGAGSFNQLINGVLNNSDKMQSLQNFFEGVGSDDTSGVWENEPNVRPEFRAQNQKKLEKAARAAKAQEMI